MKLHLILLFVLVCMVVPAFSAQLPPIDWASVAVEKEAFLETEPGRYGNAGRFDGVGMIYFSASKKIIDFKGLTRMELPRMGQQVDDRYEFRHESFTIESVIPTGDGEYAFQAVNDGPFARTVTGRIRFSLAPSGLFGTIQEFLLEEHGQTIKGVMNRYGFASSAQGKAMLGKYNEVFFGGNYVALDFGK